MTILFEGQQIRDTFLVERFLGEGAFAEVYRVRHRFLGRQAMKVFKATGATISEAAQLLAEAVLLSKIGHPNIIQVFEANLLQTSQGDGAFFTMEYLPGGSLADYWRFQPHQYKTIETIVDIARQVCRGLSIAHSLTPPVIHRDIKPQNILITSLNSGIRVCLSDFGLAKHVNSLTAFASAQGTLQFKSPEAFQPGGGDSCASDVWALGSTLYLLLTERFPYIKENSKEYLEGRDFSESLIPASFFNFEVNPALDAIVAKALALKPEDRYISATEMLVDLEAWQPSSPGFTTISIKPPGNFTGSKGPETKITKTQAQDQIALALSLAQQNEKLREAVELLAFAIEPFPDLQEQYAYRLSLWRKGISM